MGDKDEEGYLMKEGLFRKNSKDSGHFHSNWLSMMYPRLFLAKNLLKDDGVIFVHIDDNEVHNLRLLMNEIFGEENFVANVIWHKKYAASNDVKGFATVHDYILAFQKTHNFNRNLLPRTDKQDSLYKYDSNDGMGLLRSDNLTVKTFTESYYYEITNPNTGIKYFPTKGRCWLTNKETIEKWIIKGRVFFGKDDKGAPQLKRYLKEVQQGVVPITYWSYDEVGHNDEARKEIKNLFENPPFDTPKPTRLIKRIIELSTKHNSNDIILDFFAGSGTTAHALINKNREDDGNRKFILVQLPELIDENHEAFKAGYKTIADISKERIRRVIKRLKNENEELQNKKEAEVNCQNQENQNNHSNHSSDLGFKVFKLAPSNFKIWRGDEITEDNLVQQLEVFTDPVSEGSSEKNMLYELMVKAGYQLTDKVEAKNKYYIVNDGELIIALEEMSQPAVDKIISAKPKKVITLDNLFTGNDQLKTNTVLQMRDAGVEFKTI